MEKITLTFVRGGLLSDGIKWHIPKREDDMPLCGKKLKDVDVFKSKVDVNEPQICTDCRFNAYLLGYILKDHIQQRKDEE